MISQGLTKSFKPIENLKIKLTKNQTYTLKTFCLLPSASYFLNINLIADKFLEMSVYGDRFRKPNFLIVTLVWGHVNDLL